MKWLLIAALGLTGCAEVRVKGNFADRTVTVCGSGTATRVDLDAAADRVCDVSVPHLGCDRAPVPDACCTYTCVGWAVPPSLSEDHAVHVVVQQAPADQPLAADPGDHRSERCRRLLSVAHEFMILGAFGGGSLNMNPDAIAQAGREMLAEAEAECAGGAR